MKLHIVKCDRGAAAHNVCDTPVVEHRQNGEYSSYTKIPQLVFSHGKSALSGPETQLK